MSLPERLGKYSIVDVLGTGAMGVVYKAFDPHIRRTVALKAIRKELINDDDAHSLIARFKNEAQAAGRLSHPGIVSVYEYGEDETIAFIAMEYVQGKGLREYFRRGTRFGLGDVVSVMTQLLDALAYAHDEGVIHRDIKPANLIIMNSGKVKVADFGIAHLDSSMLTHTGVIMGTPGYMAPEQYTGTGADRRSDIFSAGVVLYQLLTGEKPFKGATETVAYKICHEPHQPPSQLAVELASTQFDMVVAKALAKKPEDRYRSAAEFRSAIMAAYSEPVSPVVSEETIIDEGSVAPLHLDRARATDSAAGGAVTQPPPGWQAEVLTQIEQHLARYLGPMAKVITKRGARSTTDVDTLYLLLAESLTTPQEKAAFLATRSKLAGTAPAASTTDPKPKPTDATGTQPLTPQDAERGARELAVYVGPIARIFAKKAAAAAPTRDRFYALLAEHLSTDQEKQRFLRTMSVGH